MFLICFELLSKNEFHVLEKIVLVKRVYCCFCQLALLNTSVSVGTVNGFQQFSIRFLLNSLIANMETILKIFQQKSL